MTHFSYMFYHGLPTVELPTAAMSAGRPQTHQGLRIGPCEVPTPLCQQGQKRHQSGAQCLSCLEIFVFLLGLWGWCSDNSRAGEQTNSIKQLL